MRLLARIPVGWLAVGVLVSAVYGLFAEPSRHGPFGHAGYLVESWIKVGALLLAAVLSGVYVVRVRRGAAPVLQFVVKLFVASASGSVVGALAYAGIALAAQRTGAGVLLLVAVAVGCLLFTAAFAGAWALLDRQFGRFAPRDVLTAYTIALVVQVAVVVWCGVWMTGAGTFGVGAAVVILMVMAAVMMVGSGVLAFLAALGVIRLRVHRRAGRGAVAGVEHP